MLEWPFGRSAIGFENLLHNLQLTAQTGSTYPPYNIIKVDELTHRIEIALAGFTQDDLNITHEQSVLTVSGAITEEGSTDYLHKGISNKRFSRQFTLGEHIHVTGAKMNNGMLVVTCETIVPEEMKPKTIIIS